MSEYTQRLQAAMLASLLDDEQKVDWLLLMAEQFPEIIGLLQERLPFPSFEQ